MNAEFLSDVEVVRVTNREFVTVKREDLKGDFDLMVDISTFEVDNEKAQDLGFMLQTLGPNMDPRITTKLLSKIADLKRMPELAEELRNWQPQPDPVQQQLQQLELQLKQAEIQKVQSEIQLNQAKAQQTMVDAAHTDLDRVEQERGVKQAREVQKQQAQARGNQDLAITNALLKGRKPEETAPNIEAAIGYGTLSDAKREEQLLGAPSAPAI